LKPYTDNIFVIIKVGEILNRSHPGHIVSVSITGGKPIENQITEMKQDHIIRNSLSTFNFPLVIVKKKKSEDGQQKLGVSVDFCKLNEVTDNGAYCLPKLLDILESLTSSKYFST